MLSVSLESVIIYTILKGGKFQEITEGEWTRFLRTGRLDLISGWRTGGGRKGRRMIPHLHPQYQLRDCTVQE